MIKIKSTVIDITPEVPVFMRGHAMRKEKSKGVHDRLEAVVVWLNIDGNNNLFINADISGFDYPFVNEFKKRIQSEFEIEKEYIVLSASHTHSGPAISTNDKDQPHDEGYRLDLMNRLVEGAKSIYNQYDNVNRVVCTKGESEGFYGNRNSKEKLGDQEITVLEFKDENDKNLAVFVNLSCHPTVLGPEVYDLSGDLIGALRRKLTNVYGVTPMMMNGNAGDMSNRLYRQNNDFNELERVSSGIAAQIANFTDSFDLEISNETSKSFVFNVSYDTDKATLEGKLKEYEAKLEYAKEYDARKWIISEIAGFKRKLAVDHVNLDLVVTVIRANDIELVILPCELVTAFGKQIKKTSSAKVCITWGYANGQTTYVVEASEFNGGHDGIATNLPKGKAEEFVGVVLQHLID